MDNNIIADLKDSYGINCDKITPVTGGWLNQKWKVSSGKGEFLVKQYNNLRYSREKLLKVESALQRQIILEKNAVPCPFILPWDGNAIRLLDKEIAYMVMEFCAGTSESPSTVTIAQMQSLGVASALMHKEFSKLPVLSVEGFPINSKVIVDSLWANFHTRMREPPLNASIEYINAVRGQEFILNQLTPDFFDKFPKGIAHEDFSPDNILFNNNCVSAIIDFDRNHYSFIWHDIGRVILSLALKKDELDIVKVNAFLDGYSQHFPLDIHEIADCLRLSWYIEVPWWIQPEFFCEKYKKPARHRFEMVWLTEHWLELDSMLLES